MPLPIVPAPMTPISSDTSQALRVFLTAPVRRLLGRHVIARATRLRSALRLPVVSAPVAQRAAPVRRRIRTAATVEFLALLPEVKPERVDTQRRPEREAQPLDT